MVVSRQTKTFPNQHTSKARKASYRLCRTGAEQTGEAVREEAEGRKHVTQTPTLSTHKRQMDGGRKKMCK